MKHRLPILFVAVCLFLSGCASSYKSINPQKVPFGFTENTDDVQFSYAYDVLSLKRNKKYVKKERKHGMRVVAVRITNNTNKALRLNENLKLIVGNNQTVPVSPSIVAQNIKQGTWIYLLYLPLNFTVGATTNTNNYGKVETTGGTTLPTGPVISLANILVASSANKNFREDLQQFNLLDKTIEPGQTVYGLITLHSLTSDPIKFKVE
ncbi:hypothetical protein AAE02nite_26290 [Adhaeribacter aerolatus]|uniref:Late embryogenesis abundant protein LEA-2 subgroup domain-containing protein n=1 Tax=Adhaeribacter aerolatus TaxID=670289 RepID=A0A512AZ16_9BACT|nr:hypothetical protein [Adhaeribacter aerolatus]GEO04965.1 hypothetical protein AAE02nite_26290 [Adhaeribacter aerolatus]